MFCPFTKDECRTDCMLFSTLDGECRIALDSQMSRGRYIRGLKTKNKGTNPTWSDGSPVVPGQIAMSLHGPTRIAAIECDHLGLRLRDDKKAFRSDSGWWRLLDENGRTIDEGGNMSTHPTRMGELCDFLPETNAETVKEASDDDE